MKKICPVCGSTALTSNKGEKDSYRCNACDETFILEDTACNTFRDYGFEMRREVRNEKSAKEIYNENIGSIVEICCSFGENQTFGTGFFITKNGFLITNTHVVVSLNEKNKLMLAESIYCSGSHSNSSVTLHAVYLDPKNDLALLKADTDTISHSTFGHSDPETGDKVFAIGNSRGAGLSVVDGIIGDCDRDFDGHPAFLFNALVTNGCSGGPILDDRGKVCGVIVGQMKDAPGMNYGIPYSTVKKFLTDAEKAKKQTIPYTEG